MDLNLYFLILVDTTQDSKEVELQAGLNRFDSTIQDDFKKIPGSPVAYWVSPSVLKRFAENTCLSSFAAAKSRQNTGDNK